MTPEPFAESISPDKRRATDLAPCSVSQVGDREWWCVTHRRNAEDCEITRGNHA